MDRSLLANAAAFCAALCAGASVVVTRFVVGEIDPVELAFYRYAIAMICLLPVLPFVWPKARVPAADVITIALLAQFRRSRPVVPAHRDQCEAGA